MPSTLTYPGVYVEEIPSGVRTISGVATSITAFVGFHTRGPVNTPVRCFSYGDFERAFGGLSAQSELSYAVQQFFANGGGQAYVVRVVNTDAAGTLATTAAIAARSAATGGADAMTFSAPSAGAWGNNLRVEVDYNTPTPTTTFNMSVLEVADVGGREEVVRSETFRNLAVNADLPVRIEGGSELVRISGIPPASTARPAQTGTASTALPADLSTLAAAQEMEVTPQGATGTYTATFDLTGVTRASAMAAAIQTALRGITPAGGDSFDLSRATVQVVGDAAVAQYLLVRAGRNTDLLQFADSGGSTFASTLGLDAGANVQRYVVGSNVSAGAQVAGGLFGAPGNDGALPGDTDLIGQDVPPRTGIYALRGVDLFNILSIPDTLRLSDTQANQVFTAATNVCEEERAFYLLDVPHPSANPRDLVTEMEDWIGDNATLRHRNVATYYPRPLVADPLAPDDRLRPVAPSGTMAGVYARTDGERGVWKAPAGTEAVLRGVQALEYRLTDPENGVLNPLGVNCLRSLTTFGRVAWGARTLVGADSQASEWKYVPVRRLALYMEESLYRGLQWVVFEPNDEPLWASIRLNVGAFMNTLFRQGAFQGASPRDAYFVRCDRSTTTQNDIDRGVVNIVVGFAPLKPAEFVVLKLQQIAGQIEV